MLTKVDALPRPQCEPALGDRDHQLMTEQRGFDVGRHIIRPFQRVGIRQFFRAKMVDRHFHINANFGIGVLIESKGRRGVLEKQMQHANLEFLKFVKLFNNLASHQVESSRPSLKTDSFLMPIHGDLIRLQLMGSP